MKHLDVRQCWLQEELRKRNYKVKRVDHKFNVGEMLTHSLSAEELRRFLPMLVCHTMTVKKQAFSAVQTTLKQIPVAKLTTFLTSMACAQQAGSEKTSLASQVGGKSTHCRLDIGYLSCSWLGVLACFVLVAFHVGRRHSGKNHEIEVKILKESLETALGCKESSRSNDEMVRKRKVWCIGETADQLENPSCKLTKCSSAGAESGSTWCAIARLLWIR